MCGIVGYIGDGNARDIIFEGLTKLEYRGYDSAGIALYSGSSIEVRKMKGGMSELEKVLDSSFIGNMGIGHTRWATHGVPSVINSHPHCSDNNRIAVIHNGIIENYLDLKEELIEKYNKEFKSDTDTEVIAHLVDVYYEGDLLLAVKKAVDRMEGAYAIAAMAQGEPDRMIAVRKDAPLIAGLGKGCNYIASDIPAFLKYTKDVYLIDDNQIVEVKKDSIKIFDKDLNEVKKDVFKVTWDSEAAEKEGYSHFMLKEIHQQPKGILETIERRLNEDGTINLDGISISKEDIENFDKVYIVACGTAYHAGLIGKSFIEKFVKIPVQVDIASEFRYSDPFVDDKTLFIAISQSGETTDTLEALKEAKRKGARILSIVNVVGSSVARESHDVFYTWAGPEIAVASTKAYTTQITCLALIALDMAYTKGVLDKKELKRYIEELRSIPDKISKMLEDTDSIKNVAKEIYDLDKVFFVGRGLGSYVSYEASLKLKEVSYINSFAIAAGELKHGTIALLEEGTPVIFLATDNRLIHKLLSNMEEVKARGARVTAIANKLDNDIEEKADNVIYIPETIEEFSPLLSVVPTQLLAFYVGELKGLNIDKPRNLAKSVTVE